MFKLLIALCLFVAIQGQFPGGFTNNPELIGTPLVQTVVSSAIKELQASKNLYLTSTTVLSVATQVVNGINYQVAFTGVSGSSGTTLQCEARAYQPFSGQPSLTSAICA